ncbi:hypothetical protein HGI47_09820 [Novosphingobium sp. ERN07]|uniref:hypothetical protein n=1 Tax=Novosphingobium sp. ERN07 TaxID=2726187 RepID=UPI001457001D|nr:hypothetical protein [Novosphingobium sp. ERN07]NLR71169.1 hypothetical protein [Novosphingobium sp. ERN07]
MDSDGALPKANLNRAWIIAQVAPITAKRWRVATRPASDTRTCCAINAVLGSIPAELDLDRQCRFGYHSVDSLRQVRAKP